MNKILFRFGSDIQPLTRFGELVLLYRTCYFKGKELGYTDGNIYFEWPLNIEYTKNHYLLKNNLPLEGELKTLECPKKTILPIKFVEHEQVILSRYDEIINLTDKSIFYDSSPPLYNPSHKEKRVHIAFFNYLNKYYIDFGKRPIFNIKKDNAKDKYILIHTRNTPYSPTRNPDINNYLHIINLLKETHKEYRLYRCGEISEMDKKFNDLFDKYFDSITNLNDFLKLMNNSSLFIGCCSGPVDYAISLGIPIIELDIPPMIDWGYGNERYRGMGSFYSKKTWKKGFNGIYGNTADYHINSKTYLKLFRGNKINWRKVNKFIDEWL